MNALKLGKHQTSKLPPFICGSETDWNPFGTYGEYGAGPAASMHCDKCFASGDILLRNRLFRVAPAVYLWGRGVAVPGSVECVSCLCVLCTCDWFSYFEKEIKEHALLFATTRIFTLDPFEK